MFYTIFAEKLKNMSEDKKTPDLDFKDIDFGYPRTIKELNAALDFADAERDNPEKWVSSIKFHQRLEEKYPWLR